MSSPRLAGLAAAVLSALALARAAATFAGEAAPTAGLEALHALIKPGPGEARWAQVPWMPSADILAARKKAAEKGKPLFLWYMAGEPLGTC